MPYTNENGFVPRTFDEILESLILKINEQYKTNYTYDSFQGTNMYRFCYPIIQEIMEGEITFAELFSKLQEFILVSNEKIAIPKTPKIGLIEIFEKNGYSVSIRDNDATNAGKLAVCVLLNKEDEDYADKKDGVIDILNKYTVAGLWYDGEETDTRTLSNGQVFDYAFSLPVYRKIEARLTIAVSTNTQYLVEGIDEIKERLLKNIKSFYALGNNFEPEKYFTIREDAPYASQVLLEYRFNEEDAWTNKIFVSDYRDYLTIVKNNIEVILK